MIVAIILQNVNPLTKIKKEKFPAPIKRKNEKESYKKELYNL